MAVMKVFCLCFTPRTGSVVLGCLGIITAIFLIVPPCLILESHDFYFNEFIKQQRTIGGVDIREEDIPAIKYFNKVILASIVAYMVIFTFASILMIAGVAGKKRFLLVPWLVISMLTLLFSLIMSISIMFAIANIKALAVLVPAGVPLVFGVYFWFAVYSTFILIRDEETAKMVREAIRPEGINSRNSELRPASSNTEETDLSHRPSIPASLSSSSFAQVKDTLQRAIGGTPPPPYEAVAIDIDKEEEAIRAGVERCELTLKTKPDQPTLTKDPSIESNTTTDDITSASACTTQPLVGETTSSVGEEEAEAAEEGPEAILAAEPLLLDSPSISFASSTSSKENTEGPHTTSPATTITTDETIATTASVEATPPDNNMITTNC